MEFVACFQRQGLPVKWMFTLTLSSFLLQERPNVIFPQNVLGQRTKRNMGDTKGNYLAKFTCMEGREKVDTLLARRCKKCCKAQGSLTMRLRNKAWLVRMWQRDNTRPYTRRRLWRFLFVLCRGSFLCAQMRLTDKPYQWTLSQMTTSYISR